jgi:hypothetical protein
VFASSRKTTFEPLKSKIDAKVVILGQKEGLFTRDEKSDRLLNSTLREFS